MAELIAFLSAQPLSNVSAAAMAASHIQSMTDLKNLKLIKLKGVLFFVIGITSSALLIFEHPSGRNALLLTLAVWGFCRAYYFAFYVIEHYVDPTFKFSGLGAFVRYMLRHRTG
jgi:hypothetical protein